MENIEVLKCSVKLSGGLICSHSDHSGCVKRFVSHLKNEIPDKSGEPIFKESSFPFRGHRCDICEISNTGLAVPKDAPIITCFCIIGSSNRN